MQRSTMTKIREMPGALKAGVGEQRKARGRRPAANAPDAARDDWLQVNAGARSQSDFWLKLLVVRSTGRPLL